MIPRAAIFVCAARMLLLTILAAVLATCLPCRAGIVNDLIPARGGQLIASVRSEPKTLNPIYAVDSSTRQILGLMTADLIHINPLTFKTEPALARSWSVSADGRRYTLNLRQGLRFSDGQPFDAEDVVFTFEVHLNESVHSAQRDLLIVAGKPIQVEKLDQYKIRVTLAQPYAAAERLFDGVAILPRHLLRTAYENGTLAKTWNLNTSSSAIAGLGPFAFKKCIPGQQIELERNPYYWKTDANGIREPYLDAVTFLYSADGDAEALRFQAGEIDVIDRLSAAKFVALGQHLAKGADQLYDLGPGLDYDFLFFNLNDLSARSLSAIAAKQGWFEQVAFRQAVSAAIDRTAITRIVYGGRARALWSTVPAGNQKWLDHSIPARPFSGLDGRAVLHTAGFYWDNEGQLLDSHGTRVVFSIIVNAANERHLRTATLIQADVQRLGIDVNIVPLEHHTFLDRVFKSYEYEAAILTLASGDADPNAEMSVWKSGGSTHVWNFESRAPAPDWQKEIDELMNRQMTAVDEKERKVMYDRVQEIVWQQLPIICLVSSNVLVGASTRVGNFHPAILGDHTLWNADALFLSAGNRTR